MRGQGRPRLREHRQASWRTVAEPQGGSGQEELGGVSGEGGWSRLHQAARSECEGLQVTWRQEKDLTPSSRPPLP